MGSATFVAESRRMFRFTWKERRPSKLEFELLCTLGACIWEVKAAIARKWWSSSRLKLLIYFVVLYGTSIEETKWCIRSIAQGNILFEYCIDDDVLSQNSRSKINTKTNTKRSKGGNY